MSVNLLNTDNKIAHWRTKSRAVNKYQFIYHFLPHPHENRRATLLSLKSLAFYCVAVVFVAGLFKIIPQYFPNILGYATNINVSDLLTYTNKIREESGLPDLKLNQELTSAAQKKAAHMFKYGYWAHVAPDGTEPWDFILGENYDYTYAGENLAKNFSDSYDVVEAWYNSPSHRENLLNTHYTEVGFASLDGTLNGNETTLVVQMFGKPRLPTQMAGVNAPDQANVKNQVSVETTKSATTTSTAPFGSSGTTQQGSVKPLMDVRVASKGMTVLFGLFLVVLLGLDIWYTRKLGIIKMTGHTWVHLSFLILALVGIWFVFNPGAIL